MPNRISLPRPIIPALPSAACCSRPRAVRRSTPSIRSRRPSSSRLDGSASKSASMSARSAGRHADSHSARVSRKASSSSWRRAARSARRIDGRRRDTSHSTHRGGGAPPSGPPVRKRRYRCPPMRVAATPSSGSPTAAKEAPIAFGYTWNQAQPSGERTAWWSSRFHAPFGTSMGIGTGCAGSAVIGRDCNARGAGERRRLPADDARRPLVVEQVDDHRTLARATVAGPDRHHRVPPFRQRAGTRGGAGSVIPLAPRRPSARRACLRYRRFQSVSALECPTRNAPLSSAPRKCAIS